MATFYSKQRLDQLANPRIKAKPNELAGRVRVAYFSYTVPATGQTFSDGDVIELTALPAGGRVIATTLAWDLTLTGGTISLGVPGFPTKYTSPLPAGAFIGPTSVDNIDNIEEPNGVTLIGTLAGSGSSPSGTGIAGYVLYVVD